MAWTTVKLPSTKHALIGYDEETQRSFVLGRWNAGDALFYEIERELSEQEAKQLDGKTAKQLGTKDK